MKHLASMARSTLFTLDYATFQRSLESVDYVVDSNESQSGFYYNYYLFFFFFFLWLVLTELGHCNFRWLCGREKWIAYLSKYLPWYKVKATGKIARANAHNFFLWHKVASKLVKIWRCKAPREITHSFLYYFSSF